ALLVSPVTSGGAAAPACAGADLVLSRGRIVTMDDRGSVVEALAVRDGRIAAAGTLSAVSASAHAPTRRIDLQGRTVLPGLIDVHTHAMQWARGLLRGEIATGYPKVRTMADVTAAVAERARSAPSGDWIRSAG